VFVGTQYALHHRLQHLITCQLSRSQGVLNGGPWRKPSRVGLGNLITFFSLQVF